MIAKQSANTFGRCKYMKKAIIGKKVGMTQIFDENGRVIPVTVLLFKRKLSKKMVMKQYK